MVDQRGSIIGDLNFYNTYINLGSNDIFLKQLKQLNKCAVVLFKAGSIFDETIIYPQTPIDSNVFKINGDDCILNSDRKYLLSRNSYYPNYPYQRIITDKNGNILKKSDLILDKDGRVPVGIDLLNEKNYIDSPIDMMCKYSLLNTDRKYPEISFYQNINESKQFTPWYYKLSRDEKYQLLCGVKGTKIPIKYPSFTNYYTITVNEGTNFAQSHTGYHARYKSTNVTEDI
jgi:hypothetical protein